MELNVYTTDAQGNVIRSKVKSCLENLSAILDSNTERPSKDELDYIQKALEDSANKVQRWRTVPEDM